MYILCIMYIYIIYRCICICIYIYICVCVCVCKQQLYTNKCMYQGSTQSVPLRESATATATTTLRISKEQYEEQEANLCHRDKRIQKEQGTKVQRCIIKAKQFNTFKNKRQTCAQATHKSQATPPT